MSERTPTGRLSILVLLATRNGAQWLPDQVDSICAQTGVVPVFAVCDDDSTDQSLEIVLERCRGRIECRVIRSPLAGGSASANFFRLIQAVDPSTFDFVALADQDDLWAADKLARAVDRLNATGADAYSSAVNAFWPGGRSARLSQNIHQSAADHLYEGFGQGCTFVMRHSFFAEAQRVFAVQRPLLAKIHYHDWALYALARSTGRRWTFDSRASMQYRQHTSNDTGARIGLAGISKRIRLIRSHWYSRQVLAITTLCASIESGGVGVANDNLRLLDRAAKTTRARATLALYLAGNGRRRRVDRLIQIIAALAGYLHS